jgi:hypothetical protein
MEISGRRRFAVYTVPMGITKEKLLKNYIIAMGISPLGRKFQNLFQKIISKVPYDRSHTSFQLERQKFWDLYFGN